MPVKLPAGGGGVVVMEVAEVPQPLTASIADRQAAEMRLRRMGEITGSRY